MAKFMVIFVLALVAAVSAQGDDIITVAPTDASSASSTDASSAASTDASSAASTDASSAASTDASSAASTDASSAASTDASSAASTDASSAASTDASSAASTDASSAASTDASSAASTDASSAAPTDASSDAPTTTPKPTRGKTWQEIQDMCKKAHTGDKNADVLIDDKTCQGSCASIKRFSVFFLFEFRVIHKYNDPSIDLADGQPCKKNGMCLNGKCYEDTLAKPCMNTTSPVTKVNKNDCSVTCNLEDGQTQKVPINDGGPCRFFGQCKGGKCENSWLRK